MRTPTLKEIEFALSQIQALRGSTLLRGMNVKMPHTDFFGGTPLRIAHQRFTQRSPVAHLLELGRTPSVSGYRKAERVLQGMKSTAPPNTWVQPSKPGDQGLLFPLSSGSKATSITSWPADSR